METWARFSDALGRAREYPRELAGRYGDPFYKGVSPLSGRKSLRNPSLCCSLNGFWKNSMLVSSFFSCAAVNSANFCGPIHTYNGSSTLKINLPDVDRNAIIYTAGTNSSVITSRSTTCSFPACRLNRWGDYRGHKCSNPSHTEGIENDDEESRILKGGEQYQKTVPGSEAIFQHKLQGHMWRYTGKDYELTGLAQASLAMSSGITMGASFIWLNKSMGLKVNSSTVERVNSTSIVTIFIEN